MFGVISNENMKRNMVKCYEGNGWRSEGRGARLRVLVEGWVVLLKGLTY